MFEHDINKSILSNETFQLFIWLKERSLEKTVESFYSTNKTFGES